MDASEAMEGTLFITAAEMAEILGISKPYAYKRIMGYAIVGYFDRETDEKIRRLWKDLMINYIILKIIPISNLLCTKILKRQT